MFFFGLTFVVCLFLGNSTMLWKNILLQLLNYNIGCCHFKRFVFGRGCTGIEIFQFLLIAPHESVTVFID